MNKRYKKKIIKCIIYFIFSTFHFSVFLLYKWKIIQVIFYSYINIFGTNVFPFKQIEKKMKARAQKKMKMEWLHLYMYNIFEDHLTSIRSDCKKKNVNKFSKSFLFFSFGFSIKALSIDWFSLYLALSNASTTTIQKRIYLFCIQYSLCCYYYYGLHNFFLLRFEKKKKKRDWISNVVHIRW